MATHGGQTKNVQNAHKNTKLTVLLEGDFNELCRKNGIQSSCKCCDSLNSPHTCKHLQSVKTFKFSGKKKIISIGSSTATSASGSATASGSGTGVSNVNVTAGIDSNRCVVAIEKNTDMLHMSSMGLKSKSKLLKMSSPHSRSSLPKRCLRSSKSNSKLLSTFHRHRAFTKDSVLKNSRVDDCTNNNSLRNNDVIITTTDILHCPTPLHKKMSPTVSPAASPIAALPPATFYVTNGHKSLPSNNTTTMCIITHADTNGVPNGIKGINGLNGIKRFNGINGTNGHTNGILTTEKLNGLLHKHKVNGLSHGGNTLRNSLLCRSNSLSSSSSSSSLSSYTGSTPSSPGCTRSSPRSPGRSGSRSPGSRSPGCLDKFSSSCPIPLAVVTANNSVLTQASHQDSTSCASTSALLRSANSCTSLNSLSSYSSTCSVPSISHADVQSSSTATTAAPSTTTTIRFPYHSISRCNSTSSTSSSLKTSSSEHEQPALVNCLWSGCILELTEAELPGHIQNIHVESQSHEDDTTDEHGNPDEEEVTYRCQWKGCKVFNKPSSSLSWLRNHVVVHSGSKPLCCIFDGCGERFKSRIRLQQHVSKHLKAAAAAEASKNISQPSGSTTNSGTSTPSKSQRRKKQKRRGTAKVRTDDCFDACIMDSIRVQLVELNQRLSGQPCHHATPSTTPSSTSSPLTHSPTTSSTATRGKTRSQTASSPSPSTSVSPSIGRANKRTHDSQNIQQDSQGCRNVLDHHVTLATQTGHVVCHSKVVARRISDSGKAQVLLQWSPPDILMSEWVLESELPSYISRSVPVSKLSTPAARDLHKSLYTPYRNRKRRRK